MITLILIHLKVLKSGCPYLSDFNVNQVIKSGLILDNRQTIIAILNRIKYHEHEMMSIMRMDMT